MTEKPDLKTRKAHQLTLSISCSKRNLRAGDPVPIEFLIKNTGNTSYEYLDRNYDRGGRMPEYKLNCFLKEGIAVGDPRHNFDWSMGGLAVQASLPPGKSFTKSIDLNRWAILKVNRPETYKVQGVYTLENSDETIVSEPIRVHLSPRSQRDMLDYIASLKAELGRADHSEKTNLVFQRLMFTHHPLIIPVLIDSMYRYHDSFWIAEGLSFYAPRDQVRVAVLEAALSRGLGSGMTSVLSRLARPSSGPPAPADLLTDEQWKRVIRLSLAAGAEISWTEGCLAAQNHPDDSHTGRLIAIAEDPRSPARAQAIYALAINRTDDSVLCLRRLLRNPETAISEGAKQAIQSSYNRPASSPGRKLRDSDFPAGFQADH